MPLRLHGMNTVRLTLLAKIRQRTTPGAFPAAWVAFVLLGFAVCVAPAAAEGLIETPAYREMVRGDQLREGGRTRHALARYREAVELFEALQRDYPDYKPATIQYRLDYCRRQIQLLTDERTEETQETVDLDSAVALARSEAEYWKAEAERLSHRVENLEARAAGPAAPRDDERLHILERELVQARERIQQLEQRIGYKAEPPAARTETTDLPLPVVPPAAPPTKPPERTEEDAAALATAQQALANGNFVRARDLFEKLLDADPDVEYHGFLPWRRRRIGGDPRVRAGLAQAEARLGNMRKASRTARTLAHEYPDEAAYAHLNGWIAERRNRKTSATRHYAKAAELEPGNAEYLFDYAVLLHATHHYRKAIPYYQQTLKIDPEHGLAHFNLAALLMAEGPRHLDAARTHYAKALELGEAPDPRIEQQIRFLSDF